MKQKYIKPAGMVAFIAYMQMFVPLSIDLYLPALPEMAGVFSASEFLVNLTLAGFFLVFFSLVVAACQTTPPVTPTIEPTQAAPTAVPPTPEPTVPPERTLVVCLGQEPATLYLYGSASRSM